MKIANSMANEERTIEMTGQLPTFFTNSVNNLRGAFELLNFKKFDVTFYFLLFYIFNLFSSQIF